MPTPEQTEQVADKAAAREGLTTRNWILSVAVALLFLVVQALLTYNFTSATAKMDMLNLTLTDVLSNQKVQQVEARVANDRIGSLEESRKEAGKIHTGYDERLNALEQAQAVTNAHMESHK